MTEQDYTELYKPILDYRGLWMTKWQCRTNQDDTGLHRTKIFYSVSNLLKKIGSRKKIWLKRIVGQKEFCVLTFFWGLKKQAGAELCQAKHSLS